MKIKQGASLQGLSIIMRQALISADTIWHSLGQELVVTSGTDGTHSPESLHYYGYALDFRTHYFTDTQKQVAFIRLDDTLSKLGFQVIKHKTHIHVEYQLALGNL